MTFSHYFMVEFMHTFNRKSSLTLRLLFFSSSTCIGQAFIFDLFGYMDEKLDMEWGRYGCQMRVGVYVQWRRRRRRGWTRASVYIFCCVCLFWLTFCDFIELPMTEVFILHYQHSTDYICSWHHKLLCFLSLLPMAVWWKLNGAHLSSSTYDVVVAVDE